VSLTSLIHANKKREYVLKKRVFFFGKFILKKFKFFFKSFYERLFINEHESISFYV
jgi:hypothetical protein